MPCCFTNVDTLAISYHPVIHPVSRTVYRKKMLRIIVEFLTKVGLSIGRSLPLSFCSSRKQRLISDEFSRPALLSLFRHKGPQSGGAPRSGCSLPLSRSLSKARSCCSAARAAGACDKARANQNHRADAKKRPHGGRFSIGSAPRTKHHEIWRL